MYCYYVLHKETWPNSKGEVEYSSSGRVMSLSIIAGFIRTDLSIVTCATFVLTNGYKENTSADQIQGTMSAAFA